MRSYKLIVISITCAVALSSCSSDDEDSASLSSTDLTGILIDGPVANIGYRTETKQGVTNASGEYDHLPGETVTFFIGDLEFPAVPANGIVTPLDLADATDTSDPTVVNMIRLLQTLDKNADHSDGIEITEEAKAAAAQVDFNLTVAEFEVLPAVINLITNAGQDTAVTELISAADAIQNFEDALDESYSVNLTEITATSSIEFSACPGVLGGWDYSFTDAEMTMVGTDTWNSCVLGSEETMVVPMLNMAADFDIPFNCQSYPVCTSDDFNKVITGVDQDDRSFTSTYSFDRDSGVVTYTKEVEGTTFTETIIMSGYSDSALKCGDVTPEGGPLNSYEDFQSIISDCGIANITDTDVIGTYSADGETYTFNINGTATYESGGAITNLNWTLSEGIITITYPETNDALEKMVITNNQEYPYYMYSEDPEWGANISITDPSELDGVIWTPAFIKGL
jgi:hypothetical protein